MNAIGALTRKQLGEAIKQASATTRCTSWC